MSLFARYSPRSRRVIFYSVHYAREAGSGHIEPEHILEGLLLEDPQLFNLILPEKPNLVRDLKDELASWHEKPRAGEMRDLPLSPTAKEVVAGAGLAQQKFGHTTIATQHLLFALLTSCRTNSSWFRKARELRVQQLLSKHGITPELTEQKTADGIITPTMWVLDDRLVALNAQVTALAELLIAKRVFTRTEYVALLDQSDGPLVPEAFLLPLIEALVRNNILSAQEQQKIVSAPVKPEPSSKNVPSGELENPTA